MACADIAVGATTAAAVAPVAAAFSTTPLLLPAPLLFAVAAGKPPGMSCPACRSACALSTMLMRATSLDSLLLLLLLEALPAA
jgi:hypothetical protein